MRDLLFHPEPRGKSASAQEPEPPQANREKKEDAKPEKKAALPAVKEEAAPKPGKRREHLLIRPCGAAGKDSAGHFLRGTE